MKLWLEPIKLKPESKVVLLVLLAVEAAAVIAAVVAEAMEAAEDVVNARRSI